MGLPSMEGMSLMGLLEQPLYIGLEFYILPVEQRL